MNEFIQSNNFEKKYINKNLDITVAAFTDGLQTAFSVGETIGILFTVAVNGLLQERDSEFFHVTLTSKVTFVEPPREGKITITYYKGRNSIFIDSSGNAKQVVTEYFNYSVGGTLTFTTENNIDSVISLDVNGLQQE